MSRVVIVPNINASTEGKFVHFFARDNVKYSLLLRDCHIAKPPGA